MIKGHKSRNWGNKWGRWNQKQNFHKLSPLAKGNWDNKWGCYTQRQNFTDIKVRNSPYSVFRNYLLKEIRPKHSPLYNLQNPAVHKFLTRLRLELSHLNEHKFNHNFGDCVNPFCNYSRESVLISITL